MHAREIRKLVEQEHFDKANRLGGVAARTIPPSGFWLIRDLRLRSVSKDSPYKGRDAVRDADRMVRRSPNPVTGEDLGPSAMASFPKIARDQIGLGHQNKGGSVAPEGGQSWPQPPFRRLFFYGLPSRQDCPIAFTFLSPEHPH